MKVIRDGIPAELVHPTPSRHSCKVEIWSEGRSIELYTRFGTVVECSCGLRYELRPSSLFKWALGSGFGNLDSRYPASQYWHGLGRDAK